LEMHAFEWQAFLPERIFCLANELARKHPCECVDLQPKLGDFT
jgi:hypothetical protein